LIQSAVSLAGAVPTIRAMRQQLLSEGVRVSIKTVSRDYQRLGIRSDAPTGRKPTGESTVVVETRLHVSVYDACCRLARQRGVSVATIVRAMVSIGAKSSAA
jgi:hypothetical protein